MSSISMLIFPGMADTSSVAIPGAVTVTGTMTGVASILTICVISATTDTEDADSFSTADRLPFTVTLTVS